MAISRELPRSLRRCDFLGNLQPVCAKYCAKLPLQTVLPERNTILEMLVDQGRVQRRRAFFGRQFILLTDTEFLSTLIPNSFTDI